MLRCQCYPTQFILYRLIYILFYPTTMNNPHLYLSLCILYRLLLYSHHLKGARYYFPDSNWIPFSVIEIGKLTAECLCFPKILKVRTTRDFERALLSEEAIVRTPISK